MQCLDYLSHLIFPFNFYEFLNQLFAFRTSRGVNADDGKKKQPTINKTWIQINVIMVR